MCKIKNFKLILTFIVCSINTLYSQNQISIGINPLFNAWNKTAMAIDWHIKYQSKNKFILSLEHSVRGNTDSSTVTFGNTYYDVWGQAITAKVLTNFNQIDMLENSWYYGAGISYSNTKQRAKVKLNHSLMVPFEKEIYTEKIKSYGLNLTLGKIYSFYNFVNLMPEISGVIGFQNNTNIKPIQYIGQTFNLQNKESKLFYGLNCKLTLNLILDL